jgi:hypothetical protein
MKFNCGELRSILVSGNIVRVRINRVPVPFVFIHARHAVTTNGVFPMFFQLAALPVFFYAGRSRDRKQQ